MISHSHPSYDMRLLYMLEKRRKYHHSKEGRYKLRGDKRRGEESEGGTKKQPRETGGQEKAKKMVRRKNINSRSAVLSVLIAPFPPRPANMSCGCYSSLLCGWGA